MYSVTGVAGDAAHYVSMMSVAMTLLVLMHPHAGRTRF